MSSLPRPGMFEDGDEFDVQPTNYDELNGAVVPRMIVIDGEEVELVRGGYTEATPIVSDEPFDMEDHPFDYFDENPQDDPFTDATEEEERTINDVLNSVNEFLRIFTFKELIGLIVNNSNEAV